jgi:hypothetical protein
MRRPPPDGRIRRADERQLRERVNARGRAGVVPVPVTRISLAHPALWVPSSALGLAFLERRREGVRRVSRLGFDDWEEERKWRERKAICRCSCHGFVIVLQGSQNNGDGMRMGVVEPKGPPQSRCGGHPAVFVLTSERIRLCLSSYEGTKVCVRGRTL